MQKGGRLKTSDSRLGLSRVEGGLGGRFGVPVKALVFGMSNQCRSLSDLSISL